MKAEFVFALDSAGWPALLVNGSGVVVRANESAIKLFGSALEGGSPSLSAILFSENGSVSGEFLAQWERSPVPVIQQKFRLRDGNAVTFQSRSARSRPAMKDFFSCNCPPKHPLKANLKTAK
jgi:PAS domain-containing protein